MVRRDAPCGDLRPASRHLPHHRTRVAEVCNVHFYRAAHERRESRCAVLRTTPRRLLKVHRVRLEEAACERACDKLALRARCLVGCGNMPVKSCGSKVCASWPAVSVDDGEPPPERVRHAVPVHVPVLLRWLSPCPRSCTADYICRERRAVHRAHVEGARASVGVDAMAEGHLQPTAHPLESAPFEDDVVHVKPDTATFTRALCRGGRRARTAVVVFHDVPTSSVRRNPSDDATPPFAVVVEVVVVVVVVEVVEVVVGVVFVCRGIHDPRGGGAGGGDGPFQFRDSLYERRA
mmetsp:Transcript_1480/g.3568  ORF Transcript_1480/g.3568 Transcript_1480/m.3568 type:complete len:292 (+) Transcript_1480:699-1574(+)